KTAGEVFDCSHRAPRDGAAQRQAFRCMTPSVCLAKNNVARKASDHHAERDDYNLRLTAFAACVRWFAQRLLAGGYTVLQAAAGSISPRRLYARDRLRTCL